jgi:hypothetical protein
MYAKRHPAAGDTRGPLDTHAFEPRIVAGLIAGAVRA